MKRVLEKIAASPVEILRSFPIGEQAARAISERNHTDPFFSVPGPHNIDGRCAVVCFIPDAESADVTDPCQFGSILGEQGECLIIEGPHLALWKVQSALRLKHQECRGDSSTDGFTWLETNAPDILMYAWIRQADGYARVVVVCNLTPVGRFNFSIGFPKAAWCCSAHHYVLNTAIIQVRL